ncbi:hypothetical protein JKG68_10795 [Microvirga aerilata]|uniref:Uncharacterized protein n=1 Tax=Microvirga aerilata TaxID=670292 RepID=A0A936Z849_9HYPH|nr:hypothetical protein [Microvirga aerilata]MBL0404456.1 hypothetical protein [Microvirga aerilata]
MTPLKRLIDTRVRDLGITRGELARRLGYANVAKALRRTELLCETGAGPTHLMARLPAALDVDPLTVKQAMEATFEHLRQQHEQAVAEELAAWRAAFKPHAIILTERRIPSPISICAFAGGNRFIWIDLDASRPRATFIRQAILELAHRRAALGRSNIPFFGAPIGFIVNLTPDRAIRYDLDGRAVALLPEAYRPGLVTGFVRRRPIPTSLLYR